MSGTNHVGTRLGCFKEQIAARAVREDWSPWLIYQRGPDPWVSYPVTMDIAGGDLCPTRKEPRYI